MQQDESFLPTTTLRPFSYRGAHGETIPNYASNTGSVFVNGMGSMGGEGPSNVGRYVAVIASVGLAAFGLKKSLRTLEGGVPWVALVVLGAGGAYYFATKQ